jgi:hypothetical protein
VKNRLDLDRLRVRGRGAVFRVVLVKLAGWNVLRAAASGKLRARIATKMQGMLEVGDPAQTGQPSRRFAAFVDHVRHVLPQAIRSPSRHPISCSA